MRLTGIIERIDWDGDQVVVSVASVHADGEQEQLVYDRVNRRTGFGSTPVCRSRQQSHAHHGNRLPAMTSAWESTNIANLFFARTLMQARGFRRASSAFIDGFRDNIRTLHRLLRSRPDGREGGQLPTQTFLATVESRAQIVLERVSRTSALWAQFGFLCDVIVLDQPTGGAAWYREVPGDYLQDSGLGGAATTTPSAWSGRWGGDVFAIDRHPKGRDGSHQCLPAPIVGRYDGVRQLAEHHILEDLVGVYCHAAESGSVRGRSGRDMRRYPWRSTPCRCRGSSPASSGRDRPGR